MTNDAKEGTVSVRQLRTDWAKIRRRVARGEHLILTDNGKPIMQLVPLERAALSNIDLAKYWERRVERARRNHGRSVVRPKHGFGRKGNVEVVTYADTSMLVSVYAFE
jgi:antitoxin (DNA-binding transcriptional repressor) of toxin-antitoxin stability system